MRARRSTIVRRLLAVVAAMLLLGMAWAGVASAASDDTTTPTTTTTTTTEASDSGARVVPNALLPSLSLPSTFPTFPTGGATIPGLPDLAGQDPTAACSQVASTLFGLDPTQLSAALQSPAAIFCSSLGFTLPTGSSSATAPSIDTEIIYSPYPSPVYGDYGHRYYGQYWDSGCGCNRYASPTYTPQAVVATQVATVPKGGVDTGDGSFP